MSFASRVVHADSAGPRFQKVYNQSHVVLAALLPAALVSPQGSIPQKVSDLGLALAIPLHSHVALNFGELGGTS